MTLRGGHHHCRRNGNKPAGASGSEKFETAEKFDDEAKVLYTFSESEDEIQSVVLAEEATGTVSKVVNKTQRSGQQLRHRE